MRGERSQQHPGSEEERLPRWEALADCWWVTPAAVMALFLMARLMHFTADPPLRLPNGLEGYELIMEGAAKAHEARNWALFGMWQTHPLDGYQFWRPQSPVWVYPLAGFFRAFGAGHVQLRVYSLLVAAAGFAALLAVASRRMRGWPLFFCGAFVAANVYHVFASRSGLLEPQVNALLTLCLLLLLVARDRPRWLLAAQWAFVAAFFTKQSAILFAPVFLLGWMIALRHARRRDLGWHLIALTQSLIIGYFAVRYVTSDAYWRTVEWNFSHVLLQKEKFAEGIDVAAAPWERIPDRVFDGYRWETGFRGIFPLTMPLALIELVRMAVASIWRRRLDPQELLTAAWFVCAFAAVTVSAQTELRFFLVLFPPVTLLAGNLLRHLAKALRWRSQPRLRELSACLLVACLFALHGRPYYDWQQDPSYATVELGKRLRRALGARPAVVLGAWAVPITLSTPYKAYFVKSGFNAEHETLRAMGFTHLVWRTPGDWTRRIAERRFPELKRVKPAMRWKAWGKHQVLVHALEEPLR